MSQIRSGDAAEDRRSEYYKSEFDEIFDREFTLITFTKVPALVSRKRTDNQRHWKEYRGEDYDEQEFDLVKDAWDHEHCSVCSFTIKPGNSYWYNKNRIKLLCDECHDFLLQT
jgi:hypothetical protein